MGDEDDVGVGVEVEVGVGVGDKISKGVVCDSKQQLFEVPILE